MPNYNQVKRTKILFTILILFFLVLHFLIPGTAFLIKGYHPTYHLGFDYFDLDSLLKGASLNIISCFLGMLFIFFVPLKVEIKERELNTSSGLFFSISLILAVLSMIQLGDYANAVSTFSAPTGKIILLSLFFSLENYMLFSFTSSKDFYPSSSVLYQFLAILRASRSAFMVLILNFVYSLSTENYKKYFKKYVFFLCIAFVMSIFSFNFATNVRQGMFAKTQSSMSKISQSMQYDKSTYQRIIGRLSYFDNVMLPIKAEKDSCTECLRIFHEKYSFSNQFKIAVNNLVPGDIFDFDVYPNQYFRSAFLKFPEQVSRESYTSINITLPVFLYMKTNFFVACIASALVFWLYYCLTIISFKLHPLFGVVLISNFYTGLLTFFDFVMMGKWIVIGVVSVGAFLLTSVIQQKLTDKFSIMKFKLKS